MAKEISILEVKKAFSVISKFLKQRKPLVSPRLTIEDYCLDDAKVGDYLLKVQPTRCRMSPTRINIKYRIEKIIHNKHFKHRFKIIIFCDLGHQETIENHNPGYTWILIKSKKRA